MNEKTCISEALSVLEVNALKIITVSDWSNEMGYSRSHFSRRFKADFGLNPKEYLKDFKLRLIKQEIKNNPEAIGYCIAVNCGFIDEKALHKYLNFHFDLSLTKVKAQVK